MVYYDGPFKCPFCQNIVSIDTRYAWKKHVFKDLRPYVCLSNVCKTPEHLYMRRRDWIMHMKRGHWRLWHCPLGCNAEYDIPEKLQRHVEVSHKNEISSDKVHALVDLSSLPNVAKANGRCPLCVDFQVTTEKQYEKHIGQHLEQLALFTLPDTEEEGDDDEEGKETDTGDVNGGNDEEDDDGEDGGMTIEDQVVAFNDYAEKAKAAEKEKETEARIRIEAEKTFLRRMEDMRLAHEDAEKEIERAGLEAEQADTQRRALEHAQEVTEAERKLRLEFEAEMKAAQDRRRVEAEFLMQAEENARRKFEAAAKTDEGQRKGNTEASKQFDQEDLEKFKVEAKRN